MVPSPEESIVWKSFFTFLGKHENNNINDRDKNNDNHNHNNTFMLTSQEEEKEKRKKKEKEKTKEIRENRNFGANQIADTYVKQSTHVPKNMGTTEYQMILSTSEPRKTSLFTFQYSGCLIGILVIVYNNRHTIV